ncbi:PTS lactose/cellobiose transporter subunit IIA, partial [Bacillus cereus]|nr:PTS lactose/cellobiose transporter subunit IIA [Bacillus cereus]
DHLMNAITVKELAAEFIDLYKKLEANMEEEEYNNFEISYIKYFKK